MTDETGGFVYKAGDNFVNISMCKRKDGSVVLNVTHTEDPKVGIKEIVKEVLKELKEE